MHKVAIVTPVYKTTLRESERQSIVARDTYLSDYDFIAITPKSLTRLPFAATQYSFDDDYFRSVSDYSKLLLTQQFYHRLSHYEYILIYQLDAIVLQNKMEYWCQQRLSYIGAPWFHSVIGFVTAPHGLVVGGNGGFSLRRVEDAIRVLQNVERNHPDLPVPHRGRWVRTATEYPFNEDGFWSFEAPKYDHKYVAAIREQSARFAFETQPERCLKLNGGTLPFGTHAWQKYDPAFWETHLQQLTT